MDKRTPSPNLRRRATCDLLDLPIEDLGEDSEGFECLKQTEMTKITEVGLDGYSTSDTTEVELRAQLEAIFDTFNPKNQPKDTERKGKSQNRSRKPKYFSPLTKRQRKKARLRKSNTQLLFLNSTPILGIKKAKAKTTIKKGLNETKFERKGKSQILDQNQNKTRKTSIEIGTKQDTVRRKESLTQRKKAPTISMKKLVMSPMKRSTMRLRQSSYGNGNQAKFNLGRTLNDLLDCQTSRNEAKPQQTTMEIPSATLTRKRNKSSLAGMFNAAKTTRDSHTPIIRSKKGSPAKKVDLLRVQQNFNQPNSSTLFNTIISKKQKGLKGLNTEDKSQLDLPSVENRLEDRLERRSMGLVKVRSRSRKSNLSSVRRAPDGVSSGLLIKKRIKKVIFILASFLQNFHFLTFLES